MNPYGGSEREALALYELLRGRAETRMWATSSRACATLLSKNPIQRVSPGLGKVPNGGTYVFVGAHWRNKLWPYLVPAPTRLMYIYNTFHPKAIALTSKMPLLLGWPSAKYVMISRFQQALAGLAGPVAVHPSPIDIRHFVPVERSAGASDKPLVIGRMSRDMPDKHDAQDQSIYRELAEDGVEVRLQGATCIANDLRDVSSIRITGEGTLPAEVFLRGLDIFYYRSGAHVETFGRVVFEAMACGLPVVCHAHGGYAEWIRHGENGFLFRTHDEARSILKRLIENAGLRSAIGKQARATVEAMYAPAAMEMRAEFYMG